MKRIIILLALFLGIEAKSQIVGVPITPNSTSTLSNKTLVSPTITGSPNLKGTLTGTGSINITGSATLNNIVIPSQSVATGISITTDQTGNQYPFIVNGGSLNANAVMSGSANSRYELVNTSTAVRWYLSNQTATTGIGLDGFSIGTTANPNSGFFSIGSNGKATLTSTNNFIGSTDLRTQTASTLTAGSSGTIATLSDVYFAVTLQHASYSPGDGATIYFGQGGPSATPVTNASGGRIYMPSNVTLVGYDLTGYVLGTAASAEASTVSVRVDNSTDIALSAVVFYSVASGFNEYHSMALNTDINSGSYLNIKWQTPTWVTNPTSLTQGITLWFRRRS